MSSICAIIVTYHTGEEILSGLEYLVSEVSHVVVVDNGSDQATEACLVEAEARLPGKITVLLNGRNLGLSKAQNLGIRIALERGFEWVLLLDDDSTPGPEMVARMMHHYTGLNEEGKQRMGILYPNIVDKNISKKTPFLIEENGIIRLVICPDNGIVYPIIVMASGSLIKTETLRAIGLMDESFFIDQIDVDFSLRIINSGLRITVVGDALLYHSLGERRECTFCGIRITPTNHSAFRCYHIYRNRLIIWKRYIRSNLNFVLFDIVSSFYHLFKIIAFEDQKLEKIKNMVLGSLEGLLYSRRS